MKTIIAAMILVLGLGIAGPGIAEAMAPPKGSPAEPYWTNRPCKTEDSVNCFWNANIRGNRHGHSFIVRQVPGRAHMVCVFYTQKYYARSHDYCS